MSGNLAALFAQVFIEHVDSVCMVRPGRDDWSYGDLADYTNRNAAVLRNAGVGPDDRVLVQVEKSPEAMALYLACLQVGAVYVPINTAYTGPEVAYFAGDAEPALFVNDGSQTLDAPTLTLNAQAEGTLTDAVAKAQPDGEISLRAGDDLAAILYTSGTTGRSKGAMLTHDNLTSNAQTLVDYWGWQSDDVLLHALPIYHVHGLFVASHCVFLTGTSMIFLPRFDADEVIEHLHDATVLMGVPTFYTRLLASPAFTRELTAHMRLFVSGSAPLTEQTFAAFEERTGQKILERYGMSETGMNTSNPYGGERIAGTVGYPLPGIEARITDDDGAILEAGDVGGIEIRGPNVFKGYWRMPDKTAEEFRDDGFFKTGDMGVMAADGRLSIVGREKDLVITGGLNVYPKEVEALIDEIDGVVESAIIGVPHPDFGEGVVAVVVGDERVTLAVVDASLGGRLARFKQPKAIYRIDELPKNAMGKVQKNLLRDEYATTFTPTGDRQ